MMSGAVLWYVNRATGVVTLVLFTVVVVLGILVRLRTRLPALPRFGTIGLHRSISLLAVTFLGAHIVFAVADSYVNIGFTDVVVPFLSGYRPFWVGLGTVAVDLAIAIAVTRLLRARIGRRVWRAVHWLGYAFWPIAVVHGLGTGTDLASGWALWLTAGCVAAVVIALAVRVRYAARVVRHPGTPRAVLAETSRGFAARPHPADRPGAPADRRAPAAIPEESLI
jgi:sulfoxide reductase heme-binding subunit YedZ